MLAVETVRGERTPVHDIVRAWRDVILQFSHRCILVFALTTFAYSIGVLECFGRAIYWSSNDT